MSRPPAHMKDDDPKLHEHRNLVDDLKALDAQIGQTVGEPTLSIEEQRRIVHRAINLLGENFSRIHKSPRFHKLVSATDGQGRVELYALDHIGRVYVHVGNAPEAPDGYGWVRLRGDDHRYTRPR